MTFDIESENQSLNTVYWGIVILRKAIYMYIYFYEGNHSSLKTNSYRDLFLQVFGMVEYSAFDSILFVAYMTIFKNHLNYEQNHVKYVINEGNIYMTIE